MSAEDAWYEAFNYDRRSKKPQLSHETIRFLLAVNGSGALILRAIHDQETRLAKHLWLGKVTALYFLMVLSAAVVITIWLDNRVDFLQHWAMWSVYLYSAHLCWRRMKH